MDIFCHHVRKCRLPNKIAAMVVMGSDTENTTTEDACDGCSDDSCALMAAIGLSHVAIATF